MKGESSLLLEEEVDEMIRKIRSRLGDLYVIIENYVDAVCEYRKVIELERCKDGHEASRELAEIYYLIGNSMLYDNKESCEENAIDEYISAVQILINHANEKEDKDCKTDFPVPRK